MSSELRQKLIQYFTEEKGFDNIKQARSWAHEITGEKYESGTPNAKKLEETIEESVVAVSRNIVREGENPLSTYDRLLDLYERQPILGTRTSSSVERQAYSTPVPIAYLASKMAGIDESKTVYEPTAGNGALLIAANPAATTVNELDGKRANNLRETGFSPHVGDATQFQPEDKFDVVIANPPFGRVKNEEKETLSWDVGRYKTKEIDHAIALKSLESLKDDGMAVLIIAGTKETDPQEISNHYNSGQSAPFFKTLYDNYNVTEHFSIDGGLYNRQGAGYPLDVIKIEGRGKSEKPLPAVDIPTKYHSFAELREVLKDEVLDGKARTSKLPDIHRHSDLYDRSEAARRIGVLEERMDSSRMPSAEVGRADEAGDFEGGDRQDIQRFGVVELERPISEPRDSRKRTSLSANNRSDTEAVGGGSNHQSSRSETTSGRTEGGISAVSSDRGDGERSRGVDARNGLEPMDQLSNNTTHPTTRNNGLDSELQATYEPFSKGKRIGGLVPANMRFSINKVLGDLVDKVTQDEGIKDIDDFVVKKLNEKFSNALIDSGVWDKERLYGALSAEQIDSVALGIYNFDRNRELIIGDDTGFGKTRQLAALTTYAMEQGYTPVFVTKDKNLYEDVLGGFAEIGVEGINPYETDTPKTKQKQHKLETQQILASGSLGERNMVLTTYSQMQTIKGRETDRRDLLRKITSGDSLLIMDESHLAGGSKDGVIDPSKAPNAADFARELKRSASRVMSASATFAKYPEVMDLYSRTSMTDAVDNIHELIGIVSMGGRDLQEVLSNQLTEAGEYIRRERPFQAEFSTVTLEVDKNLINGESKVMEAIVQFDYVKGTVVRGLAEDLKSNAEKVVQDNSVGVPSIDSTNFTSLMHNYLGVSNLAKKIDSAVDFAMDAIERGEKPVIGVANTVEAFIKQYAEYNYIQPGQEINVSFKDMLGHYAERSREITIKDAYGESARHRLTDAELGEFGVAVWDNIHKTIEELDTSNNPISPIDMFKTKMEEQGYKVGEITGRSSGIDYVRQEDGSYNSYYKTFPSLSEAKTKRATTNGFNNGDIDVLIGNRTMSTGISLHSSEKFADQKQRHFLLLQPEGDINIAKQFFGRFDRTGQVNAPKITIAAADIPYEKRVQSLLMGKLSSLSANTTANRESQVDFGENRDLLNKYGDEVAAVVLAENPEFGYRLNNPSSDGSREGQLIKQLTGRLPILQLAEQEKVMQQIEKSYDALMKELDTLGTNELKSSTLDLDAKTLGVVEIIPAKEGKEESAFTAPVTMEVADVKTGKKPYTSRQVVNMVRNELGWENIDIQTEVEAEMLGDDDISKASKFKAFKDIDVVNDLKENYQESRQGVFKTEDGRQNFLNTTNLHAQTNTSILRAFPVGTPVEIRPPSGDNVYGVVLNHRVEAIEDQGNPLRPSNNKIKIAIPSGARELDLPYSKLGTSDDKYYLTSLSHFEEVTQEGKDFTVLELFDNSQADREPRYMLKGNLLTAASKFLGQGKIVHYTDNSLQRQPGFLLNKKFEPNSLENVPIKLSEVEQVESLTKEQGRYLRTRDDRLNLAYNEVKLQYQISVPKSKKRGGEFFLDQKLLEAATNPESNETNEFVSRGDRSYLYFDESRLEKVVERLDDKWGLFATGENIVAAKKMMGIETRNLDELINTAIKNQQELEEQASIKDVFLDDNLMIDTPGKKAIYEVVGDVELTQAVDSAIHNTRKDVWLGNRLKEREVSIAIKKVVGDDNVRLEILDTIKNYSEYTQQSLKTESNNSQSEIEELVTEGNNSQLETEELVTEGNNSQSEIEELVTEGNNSQPENEDLPTVEINSQLETEELVPEEINSQLEIEELVTEGNNSQPEIEKLVTEGNNSQLEIEELVTEEINNRLIEYREEISQIDIQQQRVEFVASVTEDLLKYVGENYYEGSEHIAYKDEETNTLSITTVDNQLLMSARFNLSTNKWENIDSNLSEADVSHFQTTQGIVAQRIEERDSRIQQQEFVERLAPIVADYHDLTRGSDLTTNFDRFGYTVEWDRENKTLTLLDSVGWEEILTAKLTPEGWQNINSELTTTVVDDIENYMMSSVDIHSEILQAQRFEEIQPVVADILRHVKANHYIGNHYTAHWNSEKQRLTAWMNDNRQPFLAAQHTPEKGWVDVADSNICFQIYHDFIDEIKPALDKYQDRQNMPQIER